MKIKFIQDFFDRISGKKALLPDFWYNLLIKDNYVIIPIGSFCLPRMITVFCHLKRLKKYGEKSYPFDLAFFKDFDKVIELIDTEFQGFFDGLEFKNGWFENERLSAIFNHEKGFSEEEFKQRYLARIQNFYDAIKNKKTYFVYAGKPLENSQIQRFIDVIDKFTKEYEIILILCNSEMKEVLADKRVKIINNVDIDSINENGEWNLRLNRKDKKGRKVFDYLNRELRKYIR